MHTSTTQMLSWTVIRWYFLQYINCVQSATLFKWAMDAKGKVALKENCWKNGCRLQRTSHHCHNKVWPPIYKGLECSLLYFLCWFVIMSSVWAVSVWKSEMLTLKLLFEERTNSKYLMQLRALLSPSSVNEASGRGRKGVTIQIL